MTNLLFIFLLFVGNIFLPTQHPCVAESDGGDDMLHSTESPMPSWQDVGMRDVLVLFNEVSFTPHFSARHHQQSHLYGPLHQLPALVVALCCRMAAHLPRRSADYYVYFLDRLRL